MPLGARFESTLAGASAGAEWALAELYRELHPPLLRYLEAQRPGEGEDLASETWIGIAEALHRFEGDEAAFRRFAFTIARRRLVDARRRQARRRTDVVPSAWFAGLEAREESETEALAGLSTRAALARLAELPSDQAEVVLLRVLGDLDAREVALITGKAPGTVRVLQHRALRRLASLLAREGVTP